MPTLTVFTPAFNRAHTIARTYESLCRQTSKDFEWLVIDDGSTDNTCQLVEAWIAEGRVPITYIRQENQGMHGAHNTAYDHITSELNVCIDSDDFMPDDAVEKIITFWLEHGSDTYAGIIGLDEDAKTGEIIGDRFPDDMKRTTLSGYYAAGRRGDKKLVYRTQVIKSYPRYPLFDGERYVGLNYKYILIDQDYELLTMNEPLVIVDYQTDGSTSGMFSNYLRNPKGWSFYRKFQMKHTHSLKRRFEVCAHYVSSSIILRNRRYLAESPCPGLTLLATPAGIILYFLIKLKSR